ncbi:hsp70-binding protein 1 isoform X5 [Agelaius phoeniceus]|uniref:hsp70-binding protein 1 isoform X5 n=1 Tax=Agelaius phoeniceus TaxID=39638 RepID=UPI004054CBF0
MAAAAGGGAGGGPAGAASHAAGAAGDGGGGRGGAAPSPGSPWPRRGSNGSVRPCPRPLSGSGSIRAQLQRCLRGPGRALSRGGGARAGPGGHRGHEGALEELAELCESLDCANEFCSLGGLEVALSLLGHRWPPLRAGAARLLGCCAQNLPEAQGRALALGALPALLGLLRADPEPRVAPNALFALSCLVRAQPQGLQELEALGGLEVLGGALQSPHPPLRARAAFLLHCLLKEHPRLKVPLVQQGLVPRAAALLRSEHDGAHEHGLGTLCRKSWNSASGCCSSASRPPPRNPPWTDDPKTPQNSPKNAPKNPRTLRAPRARGE